MEPRRQEQRKAALVTVRSETPSGKQLQADYCFAEGFACRQGLVEIGGERVRVHLAMLALGYSRRLVVRA